MTKHFITNEKFIISYEDAIFQINIYSAAQKTENDSPSWELIRISTGEKIIEGFIGIGTQVINTTGITTGTFLGLPRLILPAA